MKKSIIIIAGLLCLASSCKDDSREIVYPIKPNNTKERVDICLNKSQAVVNEAAVNFSLDFMQQTLKDNGNIFLSPLSAQIALSMLTNGAEDETLAELLKTLGYEGLDTEDMNSYNKVMIEALKNIDNTTIVEVANSLWVNKMYSLKEEFVKVNQKNYDAELQTLNFADEKSAEIINGWCGKKTHNCINHIIDQPNPNWHSLLINALYFKGIWKEKFNKKNTSKREFTNIDGTLSKVEMMANTESYSYYEDEDIEMAELPYGNGAFSMIVAMPREGKTLNDGIDYLAHNWKRCLDEMWGREVDLWLPKFEMKYMRELKKDLMAMGINQIFLPGMAQLGKMSTDDLYVNFIDQFTYVKVDEEGTEAAAVTIVGSECTSIGPNPDPIIFHVNRPFIYLIKEVSTGAILFMGKMETFDGQ